MNSMNTSEAMRMAGCREPQRAENECPDGCAENAAHCYRDGSQQTVHERRPILQNGFHFGLPYSQPGARSFVLVIPASTSQFGNPYLPAYRSFIAPLLLRASSCLLNTSLKRVSSLRKATAMLLTGACLSTTISTPFCWGFGTLNCPTAKASARPPETVAMPA